MAVIFDVLLFLVSIDDPTNKTLTKAKVQKNIKKICVFGLVNILWVSRNISHT